MTINKYRLQKSLVAGVSKSRRLKEFKDMANLM